MLGVLTEGASEAGRNASSIDASAAVTDVIDQFKAYCLSRASATSASSATALVPSSNSQPQQEPLLTAGSAMRTALDAGVTDAHVLTWLHALDECLSTAAKAQARVRRIVDTWTEGLKQLRRIAAASALLLADDVATVGNV